MLLSFTNYSNPVQATIHLLQQLKVNVTNSTVSKTLEQHPDYPSLLSINDALPQFNVNALAIKADKARIKDFPLPFMAHITAKGGSFVTVYAINGDKLSYYTSNDLKTSITTTLQEFLNNWSGKTLLAEPKANAGEPDFALQRRKELLQNARIPLLFSGFLLCGIIVGLEAFLDKAFTSALQYSTLLLLHFAGIIISSLLLWYEVDKTNTTLQKICTAGRKTNCNAILNSKQSKLLGWLSWSEIGFYYFTGSFLSLLISGTPVVSILALLNFLALPYIIFSVYYQWRVAKQWCILCLGVQGLLLLQGITNALSFHLLLIDILQIILHFGVAFLVPIALWAMLKPALIKTKELQPKAKELTRLKANPKIFESLLVKQKQITVPIDSMGILLGNPAASNTIIKVCNPYCNPCALAHPVIDDILLHNSNVKVQVLFTATTNNEDKRNKPVKHLLAIQEMYGMSMTAKAMDDWYNAPDKNYELFAVKYPIATEVLQQQDAKIKAMEHWCNETDIQFTPTFFINGYQLPEIYGIEDVKYLLS